MSVRVGRREGEGILLVIIYFARLLQSLGYELEQGNGILSFHSSVPEMESLDFKSKELLGYVALSKLAPHA